MLFLGVIEQFKYLATLVQPGITLASQNSHERQGYQPVAQQSVGIRQLREGSTAI
jgi:hypothetical protein